MGKHVPESAQSGRLILIPSWGRSLSRKVAMKAFLHSKLFMSSGAEKDRGNPPLSHSCPDWSDGISSSPSPPSLWYLILPARDSEVCRSSWGDALPNVLRS